MRRGMVRIGHADLRICAIARFPGQLERNYSGDVTLQRQDLQIEHQLCMIRVGRRHTGRPVEIGQRIV